MPEFLFYIIIPGRRKLLFNNALELDDYINLHNLPKNSKIYITQDNKPAGEMLVTRYLELRSQNDKRINNN